MRDAQPQACNVIAGGHVADTAGAAIDSICPPTGETVARLHEAGTIRISTYNAAPVEAPFGGTRLSGVGHEKSKAAIEYRSETRSVYVAAGECEVSM